MQKKEDQGLSLRTLSNLRTQGEEEELPKRNWERRMDDGEEKLGKRNFQPKWRGIDLLRRLMGNAAKSSGSGIFGAKGWVERAYERIGEEELEISIKQLYQSFTVKGNKEMKLQ